MIFLRIKDPSKRNDMVQQVLRTKDSIKAQSKSSQIYDMNNEHIIIFLNYIKQLAMRPLQIQLPPLPQL